MNELSAPIATDPSVRPATKAQMFEGVQILRGIAASMVVFHHMCIVLNTYHPTPPFIATYRRVTELGASGVDIFFCISGLVIAHAARKLPAGGRSAATFAWRRVLRVMPPYWVFTAALVALWGLGIGLKNLVMTPGLLASSFLLIPYPKVTTAGVVSYHPILDVGWTLTFEMYFYAICAVVIAFAGGRRVWPWIVVALAGLAALSHLLAPTSVATSILASPLLIEFVAGTVLARYVAGRTDSRLGWTLVTVGAVALLASIYLLDPMSWRVLCWGVPGVLLVSGAVLIPITLSNPMIRFFSFLGTASYTIYLAHPFFTLVLGTVMKRGLLVTIAPDALLIVFTIVAVLGSAVTYFAVEGPLVQLLKPRSRTAAEAREVLST